MEERKLPWAALVLTLTRIVWSVKSPTVWVDQLGKERVVNEEAPRDVLNSVKQACVQWILQKVVKHAGYEESETWWEPLRVVVELSEEKLWKGDTCEEIFEEIGEN